MTDSLAQQISLEQWNEESKTNTRLLPKYGHIPKTQSQIDSDNRFIESILKTDSTHKAASEHLVNLGFKYLYRDIKTAMYRFNQAYLLDSTNSNIYWGYGAVYFTLGDYARAKEQYLIGLNKDPENSNLLTDYGTYFLGQYYFLEPIEKNNAKENLDSAVVYLRRSFNQNPKNQVTLFKLSIVYWLKSECSLAWRYYELCKSLGGDPITEEFTQDLKSKCPRRN